MLSPPLSQQQLHIISFLMLPNLLRLGQTCHYLHDLCNNEAAWCHLCTPLPCHCQRLPLQEGHHPQM